MLKAVINNYKPNPVTNIQELLNFRDPDKAISNFLTKFRNEFLNTLPETLATGLNKRNLIKNVKTLYRTKGTIEVTNYFLDYYLTSNQKQFILENKC